MQKTMERKRNERVRLGSAVELVKAGGLAVGVAVAAVALVSGLMMSNLLDRGMAEYGAITACVLGVLAGGLYAGKRCARAGLLVGAGVGVTTFLMHTLYRYFSP